MARFRKGFNGRRKARERVAALHRKVRNIRRTCARRHSAALAVNCDLVAVEDRNVRGMVRSRLARGVHDAGWSTLVGMLSCEAAGADGTLMRADPKRTSQDCSACGEQVPKDLSDRRHDCPSCVASLDRDRNAAINILQKAIGGVVVSGGHDVAGSGESACGNVDLARSV